MNSVTTIEGKVISSLDCLPITALHSIVCHDAIFLLSGFGASLSIFHYSDAYPLILKTKVFASQNIHGIAALPQTSRNGLMSVPIIVWGGRCLSLLRLILAEDYAADAKPAIIEKLWSENVEDWILHVTPYNASEAVLLTAHNALYKISMLRPPTLTVENVTLGKGIETLLYSGHITVLDNGNLLVASGTVFGEILVWLCGQTKDQREWISCTKHIFLGHKGSIFGVALSKSIGRQKGSFRLLASCSDDRTIRLWNVGECDLGIEDTISSAAMSEQTGFGARNGDINCLAMGWGHASRIWNVQFVHEDVSDDKEIHILSRGEDAMCQAWNISIEDMFSQDKSSVARLKPTWHDQQHAGKNVWSMLHFNIQDGYSVVTGGADGQIVTRHRRLPLCPISPVHGCIASQQISKIVCGNTDAEQHSSCKSVKAIKQYLVFENENIIAITDEGHILCRKAVQNNNWTLLERATLKTSITLAMNLAGSLAFYTKTDGALFAYDMSSLRFYNLQSQLPAQASWLQVVTGAFNGIPVNTIGLLAKFYRQLDPVLVLIDGEFPDCKVTMKSLKVRLDFVITSAYYNALQDVLVCGSRSGALAMFIDFRRLEDTMEASLYHRHAHGSDAVTSIAALPTFGSAIESESWWLSTGRDGIFAVWRSSKTDISSMTCVHKSSPPIRPNLEGAYFKRLSQDKTSVIFYGFRSKDFVVWDETSQHQILVIDCGGAHRPWAYCPGYDASDSIFVWTRAGAFNIHRDPYQDVKIIRQGSHGREIKAVAVARPLVEGGSVLVATAAEDTEIRIFRYNDKKKHDSPANQYPCLAVLRGHTAGLQSLKFSDCAQFLFSSAGCEEFYIWKLSDVPIIGTGAVLLTKMPREVDNPDARIMDFDVNVINPEGALGQVFLIYLAYSNGTVKSARYSERTQELIQLEEHVIGSICLTQMHLLIDTNLLVGATDGFLRILNHNQPTMPPVLHRVHQNSIVDMSVQIIDSTRTIVATGGDDNALSLTLITFAPVPHLETIVVTDAHASAVTGVLVVDYDHQTDKAIIVSAGNDQKVKIWELQHRVNDNIFDDNLIVHQNDRQLVRQRILKFGEYDTEVADVSGVDLMGATKDTQQERPLSEEFEILVVGVGSQTLRLPRIRV